MENPNPGRTDTLRRLNRTEYENAIRDLLALEIDGAALLPVSGHGFDNVNVEVTSRLTRSLYYLCCSKLVEVMWLSGLLNRRWR